MTQPLLNPVFFNPATQSISVNRKRIVPQKVNQFRVILNLWNTPRIFPSGYRILAYIEYLCHIRL